MSWLNWNKWSDLTAILNGGTIRRRKTSPVNRNRRLTVDPLEERQLLSVSPGHVDDQLVAAMSDVSSQYTLAGQSIGVDHDGNFVITWTRNDPIYDSNGNIIYDSDGNILTESNIYARYYTDEVQRITLPAGVLANTNPDDLATFDLTYGGNEIQQLTITTTTPGPNDFAMGAMGTITLGFDTDDDDVSDLTASFVFNEYGAVGDNAEAIQTALRSMGGALADVEVEGINPQTYNIRFGDASGGQDQPRLLVEDFSLTGFLPAVQIEEIRQPITIAEIPISPDDPWATASAIEAWFEYYRTGVFPIGPVNFPPPSAVPPSGPYSSPGAMSTAVPKVSVVPVFTTGQELVTFDITFVDDSGKIDHPEMVISAVRDEDGNLQAGATVETLKESSPEFRVNDAEPNSAYTPGPDKYAQYSPAVAMDADGDFVITWASVVPDSVTYGSKSDVFARRFSPQAIVDSADVTFYADMDLDVNGTEETAIQGVTALGNQFRVNTHTTEAQGQPAIGMDDDGNFVIAWANTGQSISFFNGVMAQRFNRDGERVGNEWLVNAEDTEIHADPFVGMSYDGYFLVTWTMPAFGSVMGELYNPQGAILESQFMVGGGGSSTSAFDMDHNFVVGWEVVRDDDNTSTVPSAGVYARQYSMNISASGAYAGLNSIRSEFRINSASFNPNSATLWPGGQGGHQVMIDADGDLVVSYDGFGPDASYNTVVPYDWYVEQFNRPENEDLQDYFFGLPIDRLFFNSGDVTGEIEEVLFLAEQAGANDEQLGRLRAILDGVATLMRGEANGVFFSSFDANPEYGIDNILNSDSIANATRDGENHRYIIALDGDPELRWQNFLLRLNGTNVRVNVVRNPDFTVNTAATAEAIRSALAGLQTTGINWPRPWFEGPVDVRVVSGDELAYRYDTHWDLVPSGVHLEGVDGNTYTDYVFEITFQGEVHDTLMGLVALDGFVQQDEVQILTFVPTGADPLQGRFTLSVGNDTTNPITFNRNDLPGMANAIQNALRNELGFADVIVEVYDDVAPDYAFRVWFTGASGGTNHPGIQGEPFVDPDEAVSTALNGTISSSTNDPGQNGGLVEVPPPELFTHTFADPGTPQYNASSGITPEGDFVLAWTQTNLYNDGMPAGNSIHFRTFSENTDTAGPMVTDFLLPTGERLQDGGQVIGELQYIVVTFDEDMMRDGIHSILDPENWALMRDGIEVQGGISQVFFGMNAAADLASSLGLNAAGSNKWEAVIVLDGNGMGDGITSLDDGHYQIVALNSLRDRAGNALGRTGYEVDGQVFERDFTVTVPEGGETRVNTETDGGQYTEPGTNAVASDGEGNYVTVWKNAAAGSEGIYAKLYATTWTDTTEGRQSTVSVLEVINPATGTAWTNNEICVTSDLTAGQASVARDADGDFVVTWTQQSSETSWDIWARRYDAAGNALGEAFLVNATTEGTQNQPAVAMDTDGDFIIVWQSLGQDGSGWGVYGQRYDTEGNPIGGTDEIQMLNFVNSPTGTFAIRWAGDSAAPDVTNDITFGGNTFAIVDTVQAELERLGAEVEVYAISSTQIVVAFVGGDGSMDVPQMAIDHATVSGQPGARIEISTEVQGAAGEFLVNQTTDGNQTSPDVAMSSDGTIVVSWTSSGQDGDAPYETNVYARQFLSNDAVRSSRASLDGIIASTESSLPVGWSIDPLMTTVEDPNNYLVNPGEGYDGVTQIVCDQGWYGSGSVLLSGRHVLTAAHVVCDDYGNAVAPEDLTVILYLETGTVQLAVSEVYVHPLWSGSVGGGGDIAVIVLAQPVSAGVDVYDIYRGSDEIGRTFQKVGFGATGTGETGYTYSDQQKRTGQNVYEVLDSAFGFYGDTLMYDFDNGDAQYDALGTLLGIANTGLGNEEICGAPGDSGGPNMVNGVIYGVTSYGLSVPGEHDYLEGINSSYGDIGGDVRVSDYASWIDMITSTGTGEILVNQTITSNQMWSSVAADSVGNFVVTWTSFGQDGVGSGPGAGAGGENGIYARRFDSGGTAVSNEFLVNTFADGDQQYSQVSMDADGDFVIVWESFQDKPDAATGGSDSASSFGVFAQRYVSTAAMEGNTFVGPNGESGSEVRVHTTLSGDQRYPSVAMDATGDFMVVWSGAGIGDLQGVFYQRYEKVLDDAGPVVSDVFAVDPDSELDQVLSGDVLPYTVAQFVLNFDENLNVEDGTGGTNSILNTSNWTLTRDGSVVFGGVSSVSFAFNEATQKYQAIVTFDGDAGETGLQALDEGRYVLSISPRVEDIFGNALDGDYNGVPGGTFNREFVIRMGSDDDEDPAPGPGDPGDDDEDESVTDSILGNQDSPCVASNADGDYVAIWVTRGTGTDWYNQGNIVGQRYTAAGTKVGVQFTVCSFDGGSQVQPDVAMDSFGNFVVTWAGEGETDESGIWARVYDAFGVPLGDQFRVNQHVPEAQSVPAVAVDGSGNFVIAWASYGQDARSSAPTTSIYARVFNPYGSAVTNEFLVNAYGQNNQTNPDVAMDADGNFVVIWQSEKQDGNQWGIYGQRYNAAGNKVGSEFLINTRTEDKQQDPSVAMDLAGNFVVVWADFGRDGSDYGIYARRYSASGGALDATEFRVNQYTTNYQWQPSVDMDNSGNFVVTWTTMGQDREDGVKDFGIFARAFNANGTDWINPGTGTALGEFRVNANTVGDQVTPDIAVDANGDFVVVWVGPDGSGTGVFHRPVGMTASATSSEDPPSGGTVPGSGSAKTLFDLVGWASDGGWWVGESDGISSFASQYGTKWSTNVNWTSVMVGDFNGDGLDDIIGRVSHNGDWWVATSNGDGTFTNQRWTRWSANVDWTNIMVGDFNGDGADDLVGRVSHNGDWWVATSNGTDGFTNHRWTRWSANVGWTSIMVGDFNGDGTDDLVGRVSHNGDWYVATSNGTDAFTNAKWTRWSANVDWTSIMVGDFNGDGTDDLVGRVSHNGDWYVATSNGTDAFTNAKWTRWSANVDWTSIMVGDFNGDGTDDLVGRVSHNGDWYVATSNGTDAFTNAKWTRWSANVDWTSIMVGDFNGDGADDLVGRVSHNGDWYVATSNGTDAFTNAKWTRWSANAGWGHVMVGNFTAAAMQAEGTPAEGQPEAETLAVNDLKAVVEEAVLRLSSDLEQMAFQVHIADLAGQKLAITTGDSILIDDDAAGFGWYVGTTDDAFEATGVEGELAARAGSEAAQNMDLLTVVMHEMGHLLGYSHEAEGLMQPTLAAGVRLLPAGDLAAAAVPEQAYRTMAWLDDLAESRREKSDSSLQVQAVDEALKVYWS